MSVEIHAGHLMVVVVQDGERLHVFPLIESDSKAGERSKNVLGVPSSASNNLVVGTNTERRDAFGR